MHYSRRAGETRKPSPGAPCPREERAPGQGLVLVARKGVTLVELQRRWRFEEDPADPAETGQLQGEGPLDRPAPRRGAAGLTALETRVAKQVRERRDRQSLHFLRGLQ